MTLLLLSCVALSSNIANVNPLQVESSKQSGSADCELVTCTVDELHPHSSYVQRRIKVPAPRLFVLDELGELAFREPLVITRCRTILDGYSRWELARQQGRPTLKCYLSDLTGPEALQWLIQRHCRSKGLSDFCRIVLALELEPWFKEKARSNQRAGGHAKALSNLTEAERLDCRARVAAGVCEGNVTKVKQLSRHIRPEILNALMSGEISIHRAWKWSKESSEQQWDNLQHYQSEKGIRKTIRTLISRHCLKDSTPVLDVRDLSRQLSSIRFKNPDQIRVRVMRIPGRAIFLSEELLHEIEIKKELPHTCARDSR